jgi:hypothetical protein
MKVFLSSTCYDLIDLRAELAHVFREMGATPLLSDERSSDFQLNGTADENSIRTCLENVRLADAVVVVLSQRYGPTLPPPFDPVSATHLEYRTAKAAGKRLYVYIRDRLAADFEIWVSQKKPAGFRGAWVRTENEHGLFRLIDEHRQLVQGGKAEANNWWTTFVSSADLKDEIRKRFSEQVALASAENLIATGTVPLLVVSAPGVERVPDGHGSFAYRFSFEVVNAGPVTAVEVQAMLMTEAVTGLGGKARGEIAPGTIAVIPPGHDVASRLVRTVAIEISADRISELFQGRKPGGRYSFQWFLHLDSMSPSGHVFRDKILLDLHFEQDEFSYRKPPAYLGKSIVLTANLLMRDD